MSRLNTTPVNILALASAPSTPTPRTGDVYYNTTNNTIYAYNGTTWVASGGGGSASITVSDTPPSSPASGALWFNSTTTQTFIYYSSTWVEIGTNTNVAGAATLTRWSKTVASSTASFSGNDDYTQTLSYIAGKELVYLNGVLLYRDTDYTATDGLTITLATAAAVGDVLLVVTFGNFSIVSTINGGNALSSQTVLKWRQDTSANWASSNPVLAVGEIGYDTTTGGFKIGNGSTAWNSLSYTAGGGFNFYTYTATSGQTVISGADSNGATLSYVVGKELVYINGVLQVRGSDYTATTGTSVTISSALTLGANVTIISYTSFNVANAVPLSTVTAKGDLIVASASGAVTNKAVGADGSILMADSTSATGVNWAGYSVAGKNAIINGNFDFWQRGTSFSFAAGGATTSRYTTDRWSYGGEAGFTISRQTAVNTGSSYALRLQRNASSTSTGDQFLAYVLESSMAQQFAGKTATLSFYLRKGADYSGSSTYALIRTGTGIDEGVSAMYMSSWTGYVQTIKTQVPTTTSTRYSFTFTIPSNVKELGFLIGYNNAQGTAGANDWIEYEQMQFELGDVATPFSRAGGTIQGELAACQRYYFRFIGNGSYTYAGYGTGPAGSTTVAYPVITHPVPMRILPSSIDGNSLAVTDGVNAAVAVTSTTIAQANEYQTAIAANVSSGLTQFRTYRLCNNNTSTGYFGLSAEL